MTPEQTAAASKGAVRFLGTAFTECPKTLQRARELGLTGWAFFVSGLGAALGDVDAGVVAASIGFIAPEAVAEGWAAARSACPIPRIAQEHLAQCRRWGAQRLDRFAGVWRLADLTERVVRAADAAGMPLFAAWRAVSEATITSDGGPGARTAVLMHALRHHRAGAHLIAVRAAGLHPLQAITAGPDGESGAIAFGWQPPYPAHEPLVRRRLWAEAVTDRLAGAAFGVLDQAERDEFVRLSALTEEVAGEPTGELPAVRATARAVVRGAVPYADTWPDVTAWPSGSAGTATP